MTPQLPKDPLEMDTDQDLLPQNLVLPEYVTDLKLLSSGGMGAVYEAKNKETGQRLAVKVLLPRYMDDEVTRKRFVQESKTITSLNDPHIVASYDCGAPEAKAPYLVMEFVDGSTLAKQIRDNGPMPVPDAIKVFLQVASGLAHAHAKGILHRDIKPSNIMLASTDSGTINVKLVDFGMAKFYRDQTAMQEALTISGNIVGTPLFMSPEQCLNNPLDARADIYSLGCVIYFATTGKLAIDGSTVVEMFSKHCTAEPDLSIVPESIRTVVARCLEKAPADRYQTVEELKEDLLLMQKIGKPKFHLTGRQRQSLKRVILTIVWLVLGFTVGYIAMVGSQWVFGQ